MDNITKVILILVLYAPVIILGGIVAQRKGDYFSRGSAICAITWVFGLFYMLRAPKSKAREGNKENLLEWHIHGAAGGMAFLAFIILCLIVWIIL